MPAAFWHFEHHIQLIFEMLCQFHFIQLFLVIRFPICFLKRHFLNKNVFVLQLVQKLAGSSHFFQMTKRFFLLSAECYIFQTYCEAGDTREYQCWNLEQKTKRAE